MALVSTNTQTNSNHAFCWGSFLEKIRVFVNEIRAKTYLINSNLIRTKPLFIVRAFVYYFCKVVFKSTKIQCVVLASHYKCNYSCVHCSQEVFFREDLAHKEQLSTDEMIDLIKQCVANGVLSFDFMGGENYLDRNFDKLVAACDPKRHYITLCTNGSMMTEKNIKKLMAMGVDKLNISIDSWDAEEHDAFRRYKGAHKKAFVAVERAKKLGMGVGISMVVFKDFTQTSGFQKLVEWCIETKSRLCFVLATPIGNWEGKKDEIIVTDDDRRAMLSYTRKYPFITRNCGVEGNNRKCPALHEMLAITAYGDVLPCDWMHVGMGNIRNQSLFSIIEKGKKVRYLNGNYNTCIVAEEHEFIDNVMGKAYKTKSFPIDAEDVFEELSH